MKIVKKISDRIHFTLDVRWHNFNASQMWCILIYFSWIYLCFFLFANFTIGALFWSGPGCIVLFKWLHVNDVIKSRNSRMPWYDGMYSICDCTWTKDAKPIRFCLPKPLTYRTRSYTSLLLPLLLFIYTRYIWNGIYPPLYRTVCVLCDFLEGKKTHNKIIA